MKVALFPGQGIDAGVLLGALPASDPLVETASELLCYDLHKRVAAVAKRPRSVLPTSLAQPAIFTASVVSWFRSGTPCDAIVGHSLGEYAALVAGEAMSFPHALAVVQVRGEEMNAAARSLPGAMVALLHLPLETCEDIAVASGAAVANDNAPGQVVLSGSEPSLAIASERAKRAGGRAVRLDVSGAFHSPAMASAAEPVRTALDHVTIRSPKVKVISNVTAQHYRAPGEIRKLLVGQLTSRVRFREAIQNLSDTGSLDFHDFGPGRVVQGLASRIVSALRSETVASPS